MKKCLPLDSIWRKTLQQTLLFLLFILLGIQTIATPAHATGIYQIPPLSASEQTWVIDEASVLSRVNQGSINSKLKKLAQQTGEEVRIVTIHRLDYGETIQSFANGLFEKWFPTESAQAHQSLLAIDTLTNTAAIRTGTSIKALMPDETAESIASETLLVPLRQGDKYNQALADASDRMIAILSGQPDPGPPDVKEEIPTGGTYTKAEDTDTNSATILVIGLLIIATVVPMVTYYMYVR